MGTVQHFECGPKFNDKVEAHYLNEFFPIQLRMAAQLKYVAWPWLPVWGGRKLANCWSRRFVRWPILCFHFGFANFLSEQVGLHLGFERATLETDSGTLAAISFYNNTGWTEVIGTENPIFLGSENLFCKSRPFWIFLQDCRYPWYPILYWIWGTVA